MAMETLVVGKCGNASTPVELIKGDNYTQKIMMRVPRYFGGVDLAPLAWSVTVENTAGATDEHALLAIRGEDAIEMEWIPGGTATAVPGIVKFKLSGFGEDDKTLVWQSGTYHIRVKDTFSHTPGSEVAAELTGVQKLIIYVDGELNKVIKAGNDAAEAARAANAAADRANSVADGKNEGRITALEQFTTKPGEPYAVAGKLVQLDNFEGMPMNAVTRIEPVQAGSGDPSPSNVRPISGHTEAKLVRCGKNLVDKNNVMELNAYFSVTVPTITANIVNRTLYVRCKPNTSYYVTHASNAGTFNIGYTKEKPQIGSEVYGISETKGMYRTGADAEYIVCRYYHLENSSATQGEVLNAMQIEEGDAQTSIEHNAKTFTATFGQTVCGGTLDWDKGLLTVTQVRKVVNTISDSDGLAVRTNSVRFYVSGYGDYASGDTSRLVSKCNRLQYKNVYSVDDVGFQISEKSGGNIIVALPISVGTTVSAVRTWLANNPLEFAIVLPNPTTIQLTPAQLTALQGMNNIFCDAGETTVSGRKDILWLTSGLIEQIDTLKKAIISLGGNV